MLMNTIDSVERQGQIWPGESGEGGELRKWADEHPELWQKLWELCEGGGLTTYVEIG